MLPWNEMKRWQKIGIVTLLIILTLLLLIYFLRVLFPLPSLPLVFQIEQQRMVHCAIAEIEPCDAPEVSNFLPGEDICIAWQEIDRKEGEDLIIYIRGEGWNDQISGYIEQDLELSKEARRCRVLRPFPFPTEPGSYETDFVIAGQPAKLVGWSIITPTSTPTSTPTPTTPAPSPTPTPTPTTPAPSPTPTPTTPAAIPPPFQIEQQRMVHCAIAEIEPCDAPEVSNFLPGQDICMTWIEIGRKVDEPLIIYIYDSQHEQVFKYEELSPEQIGEARSCRIQPIMPELTKPGLYWTDFVIGGQPYSEQIVWFISASELLPEETQYLIEMLLQVRALRDAEAEFVIALLLPSDEEEWIENLGTQVSTITQAHQKLTDMDVPPRMVEIHNALLDASGDCDEAIFYFIVAIITEAAEDFETLVTLQQSCLLKLEQFEGMIDHMLENQEE